MTPRIAGGGNKARVFQAALGIAKNDATWLRAAILDAIPSAEAFQDEVDAFGARWRADITLKRQGKQAVVRTVWIFGTGNAAPRFVSCWVM